MGKKRELKALRRRVEQLESEVAQMRGRRTITWTPPKPATFPGVWPQITCTDPASTRYLRPVVRSGGTLPNDGYKTFTYN